MKTYIFNWYDSDTDRKTVMRLNEKQADLIDYLFNELAFDEALEMANIEANLLVFSNDDIVDLT